MKIFLNQNTHVPTIPVACVSNETTGQVLIGKVKLGKPGQGDMWRLCDQSSYTLDFIKKLEKASSLFQRRKGGNSHHLCIHIISSWKPATKWTAPTTVRVHGFLWDPKLGLEADNYKLKLNIALSRTVSNSLEHLGIVDVEMPVFSNEPVEPVSCQYEGCMAVGVFGENKNVPYDGQVFQGSLSSGRTISATVNVVLYRDSQSQSRLSWICKRILDAGLHPDLVVVASNGAEIKCNKAFLAAQSSVFAAMLGTNMKEAKEGRIEMMDMSEDCVKAFLAYLYNLEVTGPLKDSKIAFGLLKAGHKYDIGLLEQDMKDMFRRKGVAWIDAETALRLFLFVRELMGYEEVKQKAVDVLKVKSKEMLESKFYREMIQENVAVAADAAFELFATIHSQNR